MIHPWIVGTIVCMNPRTKSTMPPPKRLTSVPGCSTKPSGSVLKDTCSRSSSPPPAPPTLRHETLTSALRLIAVVKPGCGRK